MRSRSQLLAILVAGLALLGMASRALAQSPATAPSAAPPGAAAAAAGRCGVCHPAERVRFALSRHAQEEVRCVSCHGGNDRSLDRAVAHGAGFRGRPARQDIPRLCASCHADESRMRGYNLPVDQYALYQTSGHGRRLAQGDVRVAVCSDCHGAHDILPPTDPTSSVFTLNIPKTCGHCHGDSTLMVKGRKRRDVYREYLSSVHAHELFDRGDLRAPTCTSCHGVHGAAPPAVGDVGKVCGQCHTAERRYFLAGPHRQGLDRANLPECASCHGDHAVQVAQPERLATLCGSCHGPSQAALGQRLWTVYQAARSEVEKAAALVEEADKVPLQTDDYRARIEVARTYLSEALPAAHTVQEDVVTDFVTRARAVGREVQHEIHAKLGELRWRKLALILFWFYLLLTLLVLRRFQRRGARRP